MGGQYWNCGLALDHTLRGRQFPQQLQLADCDFHRARGNSGLHRHKSFSPIQRYLLATFITILISNAKPIKPAVTVGPSQKWKTGATRLLSPGSRRTLDVSNRSRTLRRRWCNLAELPISSLPYTTSTSLSQASRRKTGLLSGKRHPTRHSSA